MKRLSLVICMLFVVACVLQVGTINVSAQEEFRIGVIGPFTGPAARIGAEIKAAIDLAFEEENYTIGDYNIKLIFIDSQSDPAKATNALAEAIEKQKVQALHGGYHSSVTVANMDVAAKYKIPHYFSGGATPVIDEKWRGEPEKYSGYLIGKDWPVPSLPMAGYVEALKSALQKGLWKPEGKRMAIFGEDTDWGRDVGKALKALFEKEGFEVVTEDFFNLTQTNFFPLAGKYRKLNVDIIAGSSSGPASMAAFIKQIRETGVKAFIIADGLGWTGEWYDLTGPASNYVLDMIPQLVTPEAREWAQRFEEKFKLKPSASGGGYKYDWAKFFIKCMKACLKEKGKLSSETLHEFAKEKVQTGMITYTREEGAIVHARYKYTMDTMPNPVVGQTDYYFPVIQYFDGKGVVVFPDNIKQADIKVMQ